jgi:hypothetical protein
VVSINKGYFIDMEAFEISLTVNNENIHFEVLDYMHHDGEQCKFEIFKNGQFIASLEPDNHKHLHICKNADVMSEEILNQIADQLERYNI